MKKNLLSVFTLILVIFFSNTTVYSQTSVTSTTGYTVNIAIQPEAIITSATSCQYGYNYNVKLNYNITFTGSNIPSSLYTLQGTLGCGSASNFFNLPNNGGVGSVTSQSNVWNPHSDCSTATVATLSCDQISIQIQGPGISYRTVSFTVSNSPLPVKLIDFNTQAENGQVKLTWETATETDNDYFTIERSIDGTSWSAIKVVPGAGNSSSLRSYESYDENPYIGTAYYRLKQTDIDGHFTYSEVKSVKMTEGDANAIFAYPVPNTGNTVNFKGITEPSNVVMTLHDAAGSSVFSTTLASNSVDLPTLKPGLYVISLNNKVTGNVTNLKYVKM